MNFHEVSFPLPIAFHSSGGPVRKTEIVTLGSGGVRQFIWVVGKETEKNFSLRTFS